MRNPELMLTLLIGTTAAGTDMDDYVTVPGETGQLYEVVDQEMMPTASVGAHATNYSTWTVVNTTQSTTFCSHATTSALTEGTAVDTTPPTDGSEIVTAGDVFRLRKADSGSGAAGSMRATLRLRAVRKG